MLCTKLFKSNDEFVEWQQTAINNNDERQIQQVIPLLSTLNVTESTSNGGNTILTPEQHMMDYSIFVVYIEYKRIL